MRLIYNIQVEKILTKKEEAWLTSQKLDSNEALHNYLTHNGDFADSLLSQLDAHKLIEFNVEIRND